MRRGSKGVLIQIVIPIQKVTTAFHFILFFAVKPNVLSSHRK